MPAFDAPLAAPLAADAATDPALFGLLCPGDELAVDALDRNRRGRRAAPRRRFSLCRRGLHQSGQPRARAVLQAGFFPRPAAVHQLYRPAVVRLRRVAAARRCHAARAAARRRIRSGAALHRAGRTRSTTFRSCWRSAAPARWTTTRTARAALAAAAARRGIEAEVLAGCLPGTWRLRRIARNPPARSRSSSRPARRTAISRPASQRCAPGPPTGITRSSASTTSPTARWPGRSGCSRMPIASSTIPDAFNWSRFNNLAAAATDSEYLLFLNDDIEITQDDWLDALLEHAQRPEVGVVGPQLLYPSGKVQHAGMFLGAGIGRHAFRFAAADEPGYFGLALTQRNVIAVTGACMLMRRERVRATRRVRRGAFDHQQRPRLLPARASGRQADRVHAARQPDPSRAGQPRAAAGRVRHWRISTRAGRRCSPPAIRISTRCCRAIADDYRPDDEAGADGIRRASAVRCPRRSTASWW